ncbi:hypothetical protein [Fructobacillus cardui]|uniref:hypothetical protein n=1 Tax=Fructobacillus cardui TaxID=2893170 RepID=UPI00200A2F3C|nr:hypothetical protein [Fructobacillus cardui]MCK8628096.1 hypothetical protein [Fructobacillus cardui]
MRYNKRLQFVDDKLVNQQEVYPVNVTSMGVKAQNLVFGSVKQGRIAVRFQNKVNVRSGYMVIDGDNFKIENSTYTDRASTIYGVEYHGRF